MWLAKSKMPKIENLTPDGVESLMANMGSADTTNPKAMFPIVLPPHNTQKVKYKWPSSPGVLIKTC